MPAGKTTPKEKPLYPGGYGGFLPVPRQSVKDGKLDLFERVALLQNHRRAQVVIRKRGRQVGDAHVQLASAALTRGQEQAAAVGLRDALDQGQTEAERRAAARQGKLIVQRNMPLPASQERFKQLRIQAGAAIRNRDGRKAAVVGQGKDDIAARGGRVQRVGQKVV